MCQMSQSQRSNVRGATYVALEMNFVRGCSNSPGAKQGPRMSTKKTGDQSTKRWRVIGIVGEGFNCLCVSNFFQAFIPTRQGLGLNWITLGINGITLGIHGGSLGFFTVSLALSPALQMHITLCTRRVEIYARSETTIYAGNEPNLTPETGSNTLQDPISGGQYTKTCRLLIAMPPKTPKVYIPFKSPDTAWCKGKGMMSPVT